MLKDCPRTRNEYECDGDGDVTVMDSSADFAGHTPVYRSNDIIAPGRHDGTTAARYYTHANGGFYGRDPV